MSAIKDLYMMHFPLREIPKRSPVTTMKKELYDANIINSIKNKYQILAQPPQYLEHLDDGIIIEIVAAGGDIGIILSKVCKKLNTVFQKKTTWICIIKKIEEVEFTQPYTLRDYRNMVRALAWRHAPSVFLSECIKYNWYDIFASYVKTHRYDLTHGLYKNFFQQQGVYMVEQMFEHLTSFEMYKYLSLIHEVASDVEELCLVDFCSNNIIFELMLLYHKSHFTTNNPNQFLFECKTLSQLQLLENIVKESDWSLQYNILAYQTKSIEIIAYLLDTNKFVPNSITDYIASTGCQGSAYFEKYRYLLERYGDINLTLIGIPLGWANIKFLIDLMLERKEKIFIDVLEHLSVIFERVYPYSDLLDILLKRIIVLSSDRNDWWEAIVIGVDITYSELVIKYLLPWRTPRPLYPRTRVRYSPENILIYCSYDIHFNIRMVRNIMIETDSVELLEYIITKRKAKFGMRDLLKLTEAKSPNVLYRLLISKKINKTTVDLYYNTHTKKIAELLISTSVDQPSVSVEIFKLVHHRLTPLDTNILHAIATTQNHTKLLATIVTRDSLSDNIDATCGPPNSGI